MGYYINIIDQQFRVPKESKREAFMRIKGLMEREDELGDGFSSTGSGERDYHFSWLNRAEPEEWETFEDAMADWRFPVGTDEHGNVIRITFDGQKIGQEHLLFERIAQCVEDGSYIQIKGEYGSIWELYFEDTLVVERPIDADKGLYNWEET